MKSISIELNNIKKKYDDREILKGISLVINNDSYYAICGKSGAGKSTFMNVLGLIEGYDDGEYIFNGKKLKQKRDYSTIRRDNIGFVYQAYNLIPNMSCLENIMLPYIYTKVRRKDLQSRLNNLIEITDISHIINKKINILSGGEKQRIAIVRALLMNPPLIIADEPTGNLDSTNKKIVMDVLQHEHANGRAIVVITHDDEVAGSAEKTLYLRNGMLSA